MADVSQLVVSVQVQHVDVALRIQEGLRIVLSVDVRDMAAELAEEGEGDDGPVDPAQALFARADLPAEHEGVVGGHPGFVQDLLHVKTFHVSGKRDGRFVRAGADIIGIGAAAQGHGDGFDDDGFACACLAGDDVQPGVQVQFQVSDDGKIFDGNVGNHPILPILQSFRETVP